MSLIEKALEKSRARAGTELSRPAVGTAPLSARVERAVPSRTVTLDIEQLLKLGMIPPLEAQRRYATQVRSIKNR